MSYIAKVSDYPVRLAAPSQLQKLMLLCVLMAGAVSCCAQDMSLPMEQLPAAATTEANDPVSAEDQQRYIVLAPRTNLLLPLLNVGLEVPIGNRWSVAADWHYPWLWRKADHKNCFQIDGLSLEGRFWFGKGHGRGSDNRVHRLQGHSIGLFTMAGRYDLEHNYSGHQGEYVLGGVDYLYAMPVCRGKMHMEFALGIGYFYSRATHYEVYEPGGKGYRDRGIRKIFQYFGPMKANVTLVVPIRRGSGRS